MKIDKNLFFFIILKGNIKLLNNDISKEVKEVKKYPFLKQEGIKDCGATCLSMIIEYYKGFVNIEKLRELTKTTRTGTTAYDLVEAAKKLGFNSYGIECDLDNINVDKLYLPAIAHVIIDRSYHHFVVIYEINFSKKQLIIADPASKLKKMTFEEFKKIFTNKLLIMYPIRNIDKEEKISSLKYLKEIIKENKKKYF